MNLDEQNAIGNQNIIDFGMLLIGKRKIRRRSFMRRRRRENKDSIIAKINRRFLNRFVITLLNEQMRKIGSQLKFKKFPKSLIISTIKKNNGIVFLKLGEILKNIELYKLDELNNFYHNLNIVNNEVIQGNEEIKELLNRRYDELFNYYINSNEFKIKEIQNLKGKNFSDVYIRDYINIAYNLN